MKIQKIKTLSIYPFLLLFCILILGLGCEKEENTIWEISPDSGTTVIQNMVDGIEFKFCLLNEAGEAATVFDEGENFTFHFSVTNKLNENLYFYPDFAFSNDNDFCRVFNSNGENKSKPYYFRGVAKIGIGAYPFDVDNPFVFEQSWADSRDTIWRWSYGHYESTHQEFLRKGIYYTGFKYRFGFVRSNGGPTVYTDSLTFKINFKIQ